MDRVSVIIPNFNGEKYLAACLDSLLAQTVRPERSIVVDNGSTDRSREIAASHPLRPEIIALDGNLGFAAAANRGIEAANSEIVALLNNDAVADPRWIEAGLKAAEKNPEAGMFSSLMLSLDDRDLIDSAGDIYPRQGRPLPRGRGKHASGFDFPAEVFGACGGAAFYRRAMLDDAGLFEESFFAYLEDLDLSFRARARGWYALFAPEAVVYHKGAATELGDRRGAKAVDSSLRIKWIARNRVRLISRNFPPAMIARLSLWLIAGFIRSAGYHLLVSREFAAFAAGLGQGIKLIGADRRYFHGQIAPALARVRLRRGLASIIKTGARPWEA